MATRMLIEGGVPLRGEVTIAGAKNAASKMILASLLTSESVILENVPLQQESDIAREIVEAYGATTALDGHTMTVEAREIKTTSALAVARRNRLSVLTLAPLLHRAGEATVPAVGGDKIGARPVDFHFTALEQMGATVEVLPDSYRVKVNGRLKGTVIDLPYPSVSATETALFAGVLATGRTVIKNAAIEPEIVEIIMMLQKMGAVIGMGAGRHIEIIGVERLNGCHHRVLPDRMEAASFASLALATRGEIFCKGALHRDMITFLNAVRQIGGEYEVRDNGILFRGAREYKGLQLETDTHPGFMTDWQQPFLVVLTQAKGTSVMHETVMENRFGYTDTLKKMGADISLFTSCLGEIQCRFRDRNYSHSAIIKGPTPLKASAMTVPDIRAGLAYVVAALVAEGTSNIVGVEHLERGYEDLYGKLASIGAKLKVE